MIGNAIAGLYGVGVTPSTTAYESIATISGSGQTTVTFSSIPSTFTHLQVRLIARGTDTGTDYSGIKMTLNGDTSSIYRFHEVYGTGSSAGAYGSASSSNIDDAGTLAAGSNTSNTYGVAVIDILDYANTNKYKVTRSLNGMDSNNTNGIVRLSSGLWQSTSAITSISFFYQSASLNFATYSTFALYGIKGA